MQTTERNITIGRSRELLRAHVPALGSETVELANAWNRVLAQPVYCDRDWPPFDRVTMDGIAVRYDPSVRNWKKTGCQFAGDAPCVIANQDDCVEIMTGACLPDGADTVIPVEWLVEEDSKVALADTRIVEAGHFIHHRGSDSKQGELLLEPGVLLHARQMAICASVGVSGLLVRRLPRVTFVSTGNELVDVKNVPGVVQVRRSNDQIVSAECAKLGISLSQNLHLPDDPVQIRESMSRLLTENDIVVFSGGVSMGKADYIPACAREVGVEIVFHKIRQKPGGPVLFGKHPSGSLLLGLPGNPLSSMVGARLYLRLILELMIGYPLCARFLKIKGALPQDDEKTRFIVVKMHPSSTHGSVGCWVEDNTSGDAVRVLRSDGIAIIPPECERNDESGSFEFLDWGN